MSRYDNDILLAGGEAGESQWALDMLPELRGPPAPYRKRYRFNGKFLNLDLRTGILDVLDIESNMAVASAAAMVESVCLVSASRP